MTNAIVSLRFLRCALWLTMSVVLSGCLGGGSGDGQSEVAAATVAVAPDGDNQAPEIVGVPPVIVQSGQTYTFAPAATDADQDFLEFQITNKPAWAQFNTETGALTGTPQDSDVGDTAEITIAVTDGRDHRAVGPFRIHIAARGEQTATGNLPPVISGAGAGGVQIDTRYGFVPTVTDSENDKLTFLISNRPSWASFDTATGALTGTPRAANVGTYANIVISVSDGRHTASLPAFTVRVNSGSNRVPTISGSPTISVQAAQVYSFTPSASDADGDSLTYSIANKPSWAAFNAASGRLSGTPALANVGTYANVLIHVSDGKVTAALAAFTISVRTTSNRAPTISGKPAMAATVGSVYSFRPSASDADGDSLGYAIQNRPAWAAFSTTTGALTGTPVAAGTSGNIIISASDGKTSVSLAAFAIIVTQSANGAPAISGMPAKTAGIGKAFSFQPSASDPNGDTLSWSISNKPSWAVFSTTSGRLSGTPTVANVGTFSNISISVSDGRTRKALTPFTIVVAKNVLGSASLSWQSPTRNVDGTPLNDLAGYRIVYGKSATALTQTIDLANPGENNYTVGSLTPATWYFAVKAYSADGAESELSSVVSKTVL